MGSAEATFFELQKPPEAGSQIKFPNSWLPGVVIVDVMPPSQDVLLVKRGSDQLIIPHIPYALNDERQQVD